MANYKVGDRVEYSDDYCPRGVGTIAYANENDGWFVKVEARHSTYCPFDGNTTRIFMERNLRPAPLFASNDNGGKFKVGDRVKFRDDYGTSARGKEATVVAVDVWGEGRGIKVSRDGSLYGTSTEHAKDLVLVTHGPR